MGSMGELEISEIDVLIVGAGFGAATMLKKLLDRGFDVKVYEKGGSFGGMSRLHGIEHSADPLLAIQVFGTGMFIPERE